MRPEEATTRSVAPLREAPQPKLSWVAKGPRSGVAQRLREKQILARSNKPKKPNPAASHVSRSKCSRQFRALRDLGSVASFIVIVAPFMIAISDCAFCVRPTKTVRAH